MVDRPRTLKLVLTGGAYAGKTTLARRLAGTGHSVVPEAAMHVIDELAAELGLSEQARWRAQNPIEFQRRIARKQQAWERQASLEGARVLICDRGLPDGLAYLRHAGVAVPSELREIVDSADYDVVFLLETLDPFDPRSASGRIDDRESSLAMCEHLAYVYADLGFRPIRVPPMSEEERLAWIRRECTRLGYPELS